MEGRHGSGQGGVRRSVIAGLVIMAVVLGGVGVFLRGRHSDAIARIEGELSRRNVSDITIAPNWLDFDRETLTYDVSYRMPSGERHQNRCKVAVHLWADNEVYWQKPLP